MSTITPDLRAVPRGQWKVVRTNGIVEVMLGKPSIKAIEQAIGADCLDTVNLRENGTGRHSGVVMMVDDTSAVTGRPVNPKADALYQAQCYPNNPHHICGDVALVNDADFG